MTIKKGKHAALGVDVPFAEECVRMERQLNSGLVTC